ncbi:hypothetical protein [Desulfovibrio sp. UCD-KL4C]|uniref:hypothetical protein n=1 Tax=Desulfovibrio sp. UCD-KL4C TaxID=2578120 RepID=UPI0025C16830|nr:hypothetical protein [Desulfovibrio sp. UCD-KL4C]
MKIGSSGSNISFSNLNITNIAEEKVSDTVPEVEKENNSDKVSISVSDQLHTENNEYSKSLKLNLLSNNFLQKDTQPSKYIMANMIAMEVEQNIGNRMGNLISASIAERQESFNSLVASGVKPLDAHQQAGGPISAGAVETADTIYDQEIGKEAERIGEEAKESTEKHTEEVLEKKQEETKTEAQESEAKTDPDNAEAKISESSPETVNPAQTVQNGVDVGSTESIASGSVGVEAVSSATKGFVSVEMGNSLPNAGTSKKVDMLV